MSHSDTEISFNPHSVAPAIVSADQSITGTTPSNSCVTANAVTSQDQAPVAPDNIPEEFRDRLRNIIENQLLVLVRAQLSDVLSIPTPTSLTLNTLPPEITVSSRASSQVGPAVDSSVDQVATQDVPSLSISPSAGHPADSVSVSDNPGWTSTFSSITRNLIPAPFSGEGLDTAAQFLNSLVHFNRTQSLSKPQFLSLLNAVLCGRASQWLQRIQNSIASPAHFIELFRAEFAGPEYIRAIKLRLSREMQKQNESCVDFIDRMSRLFTTFPGELSEEQRLEYVLSGLQRQAAIYLGARDYTCISLLRAQAFKLDQLMVIEAVPGNTVSFHETGHNWSSGDGQRSPAVQNFQSGGPSPPRNGRFPNENTVCYGCQQTGHIRRYCPFNRNQGNQGNEVSASNAFGDARRTAGGQENNN